MTIPTRIIRLPLELQQQIISSLDFPDILFLKMTCIHYDQLIEPLTLDELLKAECSSFCNKKKLYSCSYCLRLRDWTKFADQMLRKKRRKMAKEANKRFCIDCGLNAPDGTTRYSSGFGIMVGSVIHIVCPRCNEFGIVGRDMKGLATQVCEACQVEIDAPKERTQ